MVDIDDILGDLDIPKKHQHQEIKHEVITEVKKETPKESEREVQETFLINRDEEETKLTLEYARRMIALEMEIKAIKDDMAVIKKEYKDDGVSVGKVNKAIKNIKMAAKLNDLDASEIEMIQTVLSSDVDIKTEIALLVKKND